MTANDVSQVIHAAMILSRGIQHEPPQNDAAGSVVVPSSAKLGAALSMVICITRPTISAVGISLEGRHERESLRGVQIGNLVMLAHYIRSKHNYMPLYDQQVIFLFLVLIVLDLLSLL